jgi:hypothetical protein
MKSIGYATPDISCAKFTLCVGQNIERNQKVTIACRNCAQTLDEHVSVTHHGYSQCLFERQTIFAIPFILFGYIFYTDKNPLKPCSFGGDLKGWLKITMA